MLHLSQKYQQLYSGEAQWLAIDTFDLVSFLFHLASVYHFFSRITVVLWFLVSEVQLSQQGFVLPPEQLYIWGSLYRVTKTSYAMYCVGKVVNSVCRVWNSKKTFCIVSILLLNHFVCVVLTMGNLNHAVNIHYNTVPSPFITIR